MVGNDCFNRAARVNDFKSPLIQEIGRQNLDIPAGAPDVRVVDSYVLPVDAEIRAIQPHAHYRAREVSAWAILPGGARRPLIRIRREARSSQAVGSALADASGS